MNADEMKNKTQASTNAPWLFAAIVVANLGLSGYLLMKQRNVDIASERATQIEEDNKLQRKSLADYEVKISELRKEEQAALLKVAATKSELASLDGDKKSTAELISQKNTTQDELNALEKKILSAKKNSDEEDAKIEEKSKNN